MSDSSEDYNDYIVKLEGEDNFELWANTARDTLEMLHLDGFITGTETPPPPEDTGTLCLFKQRKHRAWQLIHRSVMLFVQQNHLIVPGSSMGRLCGIPNTFDPKVLWDKLHGWYNNLSPGKKHDYLRELISLDCNQFGERDHIDSLINRAQWLRRRLEGAGVPIADEMFKICLRAALFPRHPSQTVRDLVIRHYDTWQDSDKMVDELRKFRHEINAELNVHRQLQKEEGNRRRRDTDNQPRQSSGQTGDSGKRGSRH